jgi:hypothetical protein
VKGGNNNFILIEVLIRNNTELIGKLTESIKNDKIIKVID